MKAMLEGKFYLKGYRVQKYIQSNVYFNVLTLSVEIKMVESYYVSIPGRSQRCQY